MKTTIKTRFAPSPTGLLHIGGVRTALFSWLYARHTHGSFVLRIEDTDFKRSTAESTDQILKAMEWLGFDWDEGPIYQSERLDIYRSYAQKLVDEKKAFWCECSPEKVEASRQKALKEKRNPRYDGTCRNKGLGPGSSRVLRFVSEDTGTTSFDDIIKGKITVNNNELDDLVLLRTDGMPTYNFTVAVDDATMGITHVIRGDDHVNNTPRQIQIYEALGFETPKFAHVPMIMGPDKTKLSKRHGATSAIAYKDMGYLPEALMNYLARLSWSHGDQEIFSLEELIKFFDIKDVGKSAAVFDMEKLLWLNHHYIMEGDPSKIGYLLGEAASQKGYDIQGGSYLKQVVCDVRKRTKTLEEMVEYSGFYFTYKEPDETLKKKFLTPDMEEIFDALIKQIQDLDFSDLSGIEDVFRQVIEQFDIPFKKIAQPVRISLTGKKASPGIFEVVFTLGKERVIERLQKAIAYIKENT